MTIDTINQASKPMQEGYEELLRRMAALDVEFIALKLDLRERLTHKETVHKPEETVQASEETETPEKELIYSFTENEIIAIQTLLEASAELLIVMKGVTERIAGKTTMEEHRYILMLQHRISLLYNNCNYHFPSVKKFDEWVKKCINS